MKIKDLVAKRDELKKKKKAFNDEIDKELAYYDEQIQKFVDENVEDDIYEDDDVIITKTVGMKKKVNVLSVLKDKTTNQMLIDSLDAGRCNCSITIAFEKELLGLENYSKFVDVTPDDKIKIANKGGK